MEVVSDQVKLEDELIKEKVRGRLQIHNASVSLSDVVEQLDDANILDASSLSVLEVS